MYDLLIQVLKSKRGSNEPAIAEILSYFKPVTIKRGQLLISPEEVCSHYYFINKGCLRIFKVTRAGKEISRYFAFEGSFCTALPSFIDQRPAMEYLQVIAPGQVLCISRTNFLKMVDQHSFFSKVYLEILELGFINAQKRIYDFQGTDALEKVKWLIKAQPQFLLRVSNKLAASYLGISPSTLSRIKARL